MKWLCILLFVVVNWIPMVTASVSDMKPEAFEDIVEMMSKNSKLCADFEQEKKIKALNRPLVSTGRFVYLLERGVLWQVQSPILSQVLIKEAEIVKWGDNGMAKRLSFRQSPWFHSLTQVFFSVFAGDINGLKAVFMIRRLSVAEGWALNLTPKDLDLSIAIGSIHITGNEFVESITIVEKSGDLTKINFSDIASESCRLAEEEEAFFAF